MHIVNAKRSEDNFEVWMQCMKNYLIGEGLWDLVSGKEAKPEEIYYNYKSWTQKNAKALHAIQISCEADTISKFVNNDSAHHLWESLTGGQADGALIKQATSTNFQYNALYMAVQKGDWNAVKDLLSRNSNDNKAKITMWGDTALHVAILAGKEKIVKELTNIMSPEDLEQGNNFGYPAFSIVAIKGTVDMAKAMLEKNNNLVIIKTGRGQLIPVVTAALYGKREMARYLYSKTPIEFLSPRSNDKNGATLLNCLITNESYDIALDLISKYPRHGFIEDFYKNYAMKLLANKATFASGRKLIYWKRWIYSCIPNTCDDDAGDDMCLREPSDEENVERPCTQASVPDQLRGLVWNILVYFVPNMKEIYYTKLRHVQAIHLLTFIFKEMQKLTNEQLEKVGLDEAIHDAIKCGNVEFIEVLIKCNPEIMRRIDRQGRTLFAHAIMLRQERILSLINVWNEQGMLLLRSDVFGNNILHLAARLSPSFQLDRVSGAALQMQKELQWYKEIEKIVPPMFKERVNENGKTPSDLFTKEHEELMKEGEKWMKNTAASCMVVATLIAAVMYTTAFTVPGGNDDEGFPNFLGYDAFTIFAISNALSLFCSSSSVLFFLGILTSRYAEKDFLKSLPTKLICGLGTLFLAIVTMMIAFGCATFILLQKKFSWAAIPVTVLSSIPIALFSFLQLPLLINMVFNTYRGSIFGKLKK